MPRLLAILLLVEVLVFSVIGTNFLTASNGFELARLSVELGLLACGLTAVIVTGGIDLSVGSLMGLCAVVFGFLWHDYGFSVWTAAAGAIAVDTAGASVGGVTVIFGTIVGLGVSSGFGSSGFFSGSLGLAGSLTL